MKKRILMVVLVVGLLGAVCIGCSNESEGIDVQDDVYVAEDAEEEVDTTAGAEDALSGDIDKDDYGHKNDEPMNDADEPSTVKDSKKTDDNADGRSGSKKQVSYDRAELNVRADAVNGFSKDGVPNK